MRKARIPKTDYSQIAKHYDRFRQDSIGLWASRVIEYGKIGAGCTVLDVGCGTGRFPLTILNTMECLVYALEPSVEMLKQAVAKDKIKRVLWIRGDGQKLPFRDDYFDCVYMTLVIHHIEDRDMALREIHRVLRKGGNCVIMTNSHSKIKKHILRHFPGVIAIDLKRSPSIPTLKRIMSGIGFEKVCYHIFRQDRGYMNIEEYLEKVRNKYISTLTLLSEEEFQKGLKVFQERIRKKYVDEIKQTDRFIFVVGQK